MEYIHVNTINGTQLEPVYNINDFPYDELIKLPTCDGKKISYYNCSASFDIETTTIEPPYKLKNNKKDYDFPPYGFMYHWQFCINNCVVFGRIWGEFQTFLNRLARAMNLSKNLKLVIYIHNLAFEFQFMKEFIDIESIFAKEKRKPLKVDTECFEFRCSYFLSNMSLAKFCENSELCIHAKAKGDLDYSIIRTPGTPLNEIEKGYCYNDVRGLCECIDSMLLHDTINTIPLTNTGYVRREYRQCMKTKENRTKFVNSKLTAKQYTLLKQAFRGGNTHANRFKSGKIITNLYSFDITSSYPTVMEECYFPVSAFTWVTLDTQEKLDYYCKRYCVVMNVTFYNINVKADVVIPYIDIAHCMQRANIVNDNGRVLSADVVRLSITEIDLDIIRNTYTYDGFEVNCAMFSERGKLPIELRKKCMEYYKAKTELKDVEGKEYEYMKSKNRLNSTYGMCVTDIAHSEINYDCKTMEWEEIAPNLDDALEQFYKSRNNFLSYQWGVYVTAHARNRLQEMLDIVGIDVVYTDTDSIKFVNKEHIAEFENKNIELKELSENNEIPLYAERNGKRYNLGLWDYEGEYKLFKTLGAKKYCWHKDKKDKKTGEIKDIFEITVSGMSKTKGSKAVGDIYNFNINTEYQDVGRTVSWYNDEKVHKITVNGCTFTTASNIGVLETTYTLGVTNEYYSLICENNDLY